MNATPTSATIALVLRSPASRARWQADGLARRTTIVSLASAPKAFVRLIRRDPGKSGDSGAVVTTKTVIAASVCDIYG